MSGFNLRSTIATVIYFALMGGGFWWSTRFEGSQFTAFATHLTIGYVAYITKRLFQKRDGFNGKENHNE